MAANTALSLSDTRRILRYITRLPPATRGFVAVITALYIAHLFFPGLTEWGALIPTRINIRTLYRLNTYPLLHRDIFHFLLNILALIPLLERFESEHGTILTFILFTGPSGLLPGGLCTVLKRFILHLDGEEIGSSVWVILLLCKEAIKAYRQKLYFELGGLKIPTWALPLFLIVIINFLARHTSFLGHLCGAAVGYLWGSGYIKSLGPHSLIQRWIEDQLDLPGRLPHYVSVEDCHTT